MDGGFFGYQVSACRATCFLLPDFVNMAESLWDMARVLKKKYIMVQLVLFQGEDQGFAERLALNNRGKPQVAVDNEVFVGRIDAPSVAGTQRINMAKRGDRYLRQPNNMMKYLKWMESKGKKFYVSQYIVDGKRTGVRHLKKCGGATHLVENTNDESLLKLRWCKKCSKSMWNTSHDG
eukprot:Sspe_Gene.25412::Locus_10194_Transcript_1_1_Confidence_1.000_Length_1264::g.25412::m.25412